MKLRYLLSLASFFLCAFANAQLLQWNTFGNAGTETSEPSVSNNANISAASLSFGAGVTPASNGNRFGGSNWFDTGDSATTTLAESIAGNDYIQFTVTPNSGYSFTATSLVFGWDRSNTGPNNVALRSSVDSYASNLGTVTGMAASQSDGNTITISGISGITSAVTFRLYGYGATAATGTGGFDTGTNAINVTLYGSTTSTLATYTSIASGAWGTSTNWSPTGIPGANDNVVINHNITTGAITRNSGTTSTISSGARLTVTGTYTNDGTTTVNGTFEIGPGGYATGTALVYAPTGSTLIFAHANSTAYGMNSGQAFWPSPNPPYNVTLNANSPVQLNSAVGTTAGTLTLNAALSGSFGFGVTGTLNIAAGGSVTTSPTYGSSSTLQYNRTLTAGSEWTTSLDPNNVLISSGTLSFPAGFYQVTKDITIQGGTLNLDSGGSSGLLVGRNWTRYSGTTFNHNGRSVNFNGSGTKVITFNGGGTETFGILACTGTGTTQVAAGTNVNVVSANGLTIGGTNATSVLDLNGQTVTFSGGGTIDLFLSGTKRVTSSISGGKLVISSATASLSTSGAILSIQSGATLELQNGLNPGSSYLLINGNLTLAGGGFFTGNSPIFGSGSNLYYASGSTYGRGLEWSNNGVGTVGTTAGYPYNIILNNNTTLNYNNGTPLNKACAGGLTIGSGSAFYMDYGGGASGGFLTVAGTLVNNGTLKLGNANGDDLVLGSDFQQYGTFDGNGRAIRFARSGIQNIYGTGTVTIPYVVFNLTTGTTVRLQTDVTISAPNTGDAVSFNTGSNFLDLNTQSLTIGTTGVANTVTGNGSFVGGVSGSLSLLGSGSIGTLKFSGLSLGSLTINRSNAALAATLGSNLTVYSSLTLTAGLLDLGNNNLNMSSSASSASGSANSFVYASGTGEYRVTRTTAGTFYFPLGEVTGTTEYSPAYVTTTGGTNSGYLGMKVTNGQHPGLSGSTNYINRYWSVTASGVVPTSYVFAGNYQNADVISSTTNCKPGRYDGSTFVDIGTSTVAGNILGLSGLDTFDTVNEFAAGDKLVTATYNYRSIGGAWNTPGSWQVSANGLTGWTTATFAPSKIAASTTIRNGFDISLSTGQANAVNVWMDAGANLNISGGTFVLQNGSFGTDLTVNGNLNISGTGTFVQNTGAVISFPSGGSYSNSATSATLSIPTATWNAASTCTITGLTSNAIINAPSALAQTFGNLVWNNASQNNYVNIESSSFGVAGTLTVGPSANNRLSFGNNAGTFANTVGNIALTGGVLNIVGSDATVNLTVTGNITQSAGTLNLSQSTGGSATVSANNVTISGGSFVMEASSGSGALSVANDLSISGGALTMLGIGTSPSATLAITRDLTISGTGALNLEAVGSASGVATINVGRHFSASSSATHPIDFGTGTVTSNAINIAGNFNNTSTGTFYTTSASAATGFCFNGTATQTFSNTGTTSQYTSYSALSGATVQMDSDLTLGTGTNPASVFTVASGATLNLQGNSIIAAGTSGQQAVINSGATVITSNADGLGGVTSTGAFRNFAATNTGTGTNRVVFANGANYTFNGPTTTPYPTSANLFGSPGTVNINANVSNNRTTSMTISGAFNVNDGGTYIMNSNPAATLTIPTGTSMTIAPTGTFDTNGEAGVFGAGTLNINGKFITRDQEGFKGSNTSVTSATVVLGPNSTIEYGRSGNQSVQGSAAPTYKNVTFSGTGTKTLLDLNAATGTITISDNVIFNAANNAFGSNSSNLTMTGTSRYQLGGTTANKPESGGTYSLSPGTTIEFTGGSTTVVRVASPTIQYANVEVSGTNVSVNATVTGMRFQPGSTFTVKNGGVFRLQNTAGFTGSTSTAINSTNNPTVTLETGSKVEYSGAAQTLTPFAPGYYDLGVSGTGTKTISSSSEILVNNNLSVAGTGTLEVPSEKLLTVVKAISNSLTSTIHVRDKGNLVQTTDGIANTGKIIATRTTRNMDGDDYIYWGQPVAGDVMSQLPSQYDSSYMWELSGGLDGAWVGVTSTAPGRGFITRVEGSQSGTSDFDFTGIPNNGVITVAADSYDDGVTLEATGNTVLLGNPYPCAISAAQLISENSSSLEGTLYFWTAITPMEDNEYAVEDYASWNGTGGVATSDTSGTNDLRPTGSIGTGQGFFAMLKSDAGVIFNNSMRLRTTSDNGQFFRSSASTGEGRLWLDLYNEGGAFRQTLIGYINEATNGYESRFDGNSFTDNSVDVYSVVEDHKLVIQGRGVPFETSDIVPLGVRITDGGSYKIKIDETQGVLAGDQDIHLEDLQLNVLHDLKEGPYTFESESGTFNSRFRIVYQNPALGVPVPVKQAVSISAEDHSIVVDSLAEAISSVKVFDLLGRLLLNVKDIEASNFRSNPIRVAEQTLIVKVLLRDGSLQSKKIILASRQ